MRIQNHYKYKLLFILGSFTLKGMQQSPIRENSSYLKLQYEANEDQKLIEDLQINIAKLKVNYRERIESYKSNFQKDQNPFEFQQFLEEQKNMMSRIENIFMDEELNFSQKVEVLCDYSQIFSDVFDKISTFFLYSKNIQIQNERGFKIPEITLSLDFLEQLKKLYERLDHQNINIIKKIMKGLEEAKKENNADLLNSYSSLLESHYQSWSMYRYGLRDLNHIYFAKLIKVGNYNIGKVGRYENTFPVDLLEPNFLLTKTEEGNFLVFNGKKITNYFLEFLQNSKEVTSYLRSLKNKKI